jgi:hypothetical protein
MDTENHKSLIERLQSGEKFYVWIVEKHITAPPQLIFLHHTNFGATNVAVS